MTTAAILCPGPSLAETCDAARLAEFHHTIAVNRAIDHLRTQWLVAGDAHTLYRINQMPSVGVVTFGDVIRDPGMLPPWISRQRREALTWREWLDIPTFPPHANTWGSVTALALALDLGADEIHFFGCDLRGNTEFDGQVAHPSIADRSAERWQRERTDLQNAIAQTIPRARIYDHSNPQTP